MGTAYKGIQADYKAFAFSLYSIMRTEAASGPAFTIIRAYPVPNESAFTVLGGFTLITSVPSFRDFGVRTTSGQGGLGAFLLLL